MPEPTITAPTPTEPLSFSDWLASNKEYQAEFDKRVQKAIEKRIATVQAEHQEVLNARDKDLATLQETLKGTEGTQAEFEALKTKYAEDAESWKTKQAEQSYAFAVERLTNGMEFTSKSAKDYFISQAINKKLSLGNDGNILGFEDFVTEYKANDPSAIKVPEPTQPTGDPNPTIVTPTTPQGDPTPGDLFNFGFTPIHAIKK